MRLNITHNVGTAISVLDRLRPQFPLALAKALTQTAQDVRTAEYAELRRSLDRPTPYTLRSLFLKPATPAALEARVWFKDETSGASSNTPATKYLLPQVLGGERNVKRFEASLQAAGHMPKGWHAVPGAGARLDAYGNVSKGQIIQVLSQLRITLVSGFTRNISTDAKKRARAIRRAGGQYFSVPGPQPRGKLLPGIYQRQDVSRGPVRGLKAVFIFTPRTHYRPRFAFQRVAEATAAAKFPVLFDYQMAAALRGAGVR